MDFTFVVAKGGQLLARIKPVGHDARELADHLAIAGTEALLRSGSLPALAASDPVAGPHILVSPIQLCLLQGSA